MQPTDDERAAVDAVGSTLRRLRNGRGVTSCHASRDGDGRFTVTLRHGRGAVYTGEADTLIDAIAAAEAKLPRPRR